MNIRVHLCIGADAAVTYGQLTERLNVSRRELEQAVLDARLAGVPIVSTSRGLHLASSPSEARQAALALRRRALTQLVTSRALRQAGDALERLERPEQTSLWDVA